MGVNEYIILPPPVRWNKWYYLMMMIFPPDILNSFPPEPFGYQNIWGGIPPETF